MSTVNTAAVATSKEGKNGNWLAAHQDLVKRVQSPVCDVLFVGDSITQHWLKGDRGLALWKERYVPLHAVNIGKAGDTTGNILWRLQNGGLGVVQPKLVVLLAGVNNLKENTAPEIAEGIGAIVKELRARLPKSKILVLGIFPKGSAQDPFRTEIKEINEAVSRLDDGANVFFLDIGKSFLTPDGQLIEGAMVDGLHPGAKGYEIWANAMNEKLLSLLAAPAPQP